MYSDAKMADGRIVSSITLRAMQGGNVIGIMTLPHGLHIPSGVTMQVDGIGAFKPNLIDCGAQFCRAAFGLTDMILAAFKKGKTSTVVIVDSKSQKKLSVRYSLAGFSKAYNSYRAKYQAGQNAAPGDQPTGFQLKPSFVPWQQ